MKKVLFAVLAAFMVSLSFTSCSKSPEGKLMSLMEDAVSIMKDTHIKSADDVKSFLTNLKDIQSKIEVLAKENEERDLPKDVEEKLEEQFNKMQEELSPEMERVMKEITSLKASDLEGIDLSELGL